METTKEAKVSPGSPGMEKGWGLSCTISTWHGQNGKARAPGRMGEPEDRGKENVKALKYKYKTRTLETVDFDQGTLEW